MLKSNRDIKEGKYSSYRSLQHSLLSEGFYKNNLKDSLWLYYNYNGKKIVESGYYKEGNKTGIWEAMNYDGQLNVKYDFTNHKLLFFKPNERDTAKKFAVINGTDTTMTLLDRLPIYLDGTGRMQIESFLNIRYPALAREDNIQGKVVVGFIIDKNGVTSNYRIKQSIGHGCD